MTVSSFNGDLKIAYFSMEIGLDPAMPTYSGGLGVLAGDSLRAAADLGLPMVGITLLYRKGFFRQHLDSRGNQTESPRDWSPEQVLEPQAPRVVVLVEGREVWLRAWRYSVRGVTGHVVPVYFLDTAVQQNISSDQSITDSLYGGEGRYRLLQEVVLGLGGVAMLKALGHGDVQTYHMNEGHSALLTLALMEDQVEGRGLEAAAPEDIQSVRHRCVFTTHTPVPAGHDQFPLEMVESVLGQQQTAALKTWQCCLDGKLNMTYLALFFSRYVNGVSMRHEEISQDMFPNYPINAVTNGVHAVTWTGQPFSSLYDHHIPEWRQNALYLRYAIQIPLGEIQQAHAQAKRDMLAEIQRRTSVALDPNVMTLGFARRATAYKRADLLFTNIERLKRIAERAGPIQVIYSGKAHPRDESGKMLIRRIFEAAAALEGSVRVVYLEDYNMELAGFLCSGVDLWLNTPQKPYEASGTSGMKAALNGVPCLSVLDGWWVEGHVEGVTGWAIGDSANIDSNPVREVASLHDKLEYVILPLFYGRPMAFAEVMRSAVAINGSFFNSRRMMFQYLGSAYQAADKR